MAELLSALIGSYLNHHKRRWADAAQQKFSLSIALFQSRSKSIRTLLGNKPEINLRGEALSRRWLKLLK